MLIDCCRKGRIETKSLGQMELSLYTNELCVSRESSQSFPISPKFDKIYYVNRSSVAGFRATV